jgi:ferric iron reductase protein FhuF
VADRPALRAALEDAGTLGPFFAVSANPAEQVDPSWRSWREFYDERSVMSSRIDLVARALKTSDRRVAASIALQGLAARLVSPILAVAAIHQVVPRWSPESLHWRPAVSGPWPLWESDPDGYPWAGGDAEPAGPVADALVEPHLAALVEVTRAVASVSGRVLRGNVASAVAAAGALVARARPEAARAASLIVAGLLETPLLAGTGAFEAGWSFRRRSCCLYYRIPGGGTCGDCVLGVVPGGAAAERARRSVRAGVRAAPVERPGD